MKTLLLVGIAFGLILLGFGVVGAFSGSDDVGGGLTDGGGGENVAEEVEPRQFNPQTEGQVVIENGEFNPSTVEVLPDTPVTFVNRDDVAHGIDFEGGELEDVEEIAPGESQVVEVPGEGSFSFSSTEDEQMTGTIEIQDE